MLDEILLGILNSIVTVVVHGIAMLAVTRRARKDTIITPETPLWRDFSAVAYVVVVMFVATILEAAWWAGIYLHLGALATFEEAMYFSMVTYTTLGYGDITLPSEWRMLSAFQAANGVIIIGWSTALVIAVVQRIYNARHREP